MKLFGRELNIFRREEKQNKRTPSYIQSWGAQKEIFPETDYHFQLNCFRSWVYVAAGLNATSVAQVPLRLYVTKSKGQSLKMLTKEVSPERKRYILSQSHIASIPAVRKSVDIEEVVEHPFLNVLKNVNPFMNGFDLAETSQLHQELTGNAFWLIKYDNFKKPYELWMLPPEKVHPIPDPTKFLVGYKYRVGNQEIIFPETDIVHFKFPHPRNPYLGLAPLVAAGDSYIINQNMNAYEKAIFRNMGRLGGAFTTEESLDESEFERLKQELIENYRGADNAGKVPLLDKGVTYQDYGYSPTDMSFPDGRTRVREEILNIFGQNLALYDKSANRANADSAQVMYARRALRPRCIRNEQKLNEKLIPKWDDRLFCVYDDCVPEDVQMASTVRSNNVKTGITSINEERKKMRLPPFPDGDEPLIQVQYAPLSLVASGEALKANNPPPAPGSPKPAAKPTAAKPKPKPKPAPAAAKPKPKPTPKEVAILTVKAIREQLEVIEK